MSVVALAWAPNALAEDSLLGPPAGVADEVAAVSLPSVSAPVDPVPTAVDAVAGAAESVEQALPAVPKPPAPVPTVAETVAAATAAVGSTSGPASSEPPSTRVVHVDGNRSPRSTPVRVISVPKPSTPRAARPTAVKHRVARPSVKPSAVPRPTVVAPEGLVQAPARAAAPRSVPERAPVPTVPQSGGTVGTPPGAAEGSWPVFVGLLLLLFLARGVGGRLIQLVPAPHPHDLLLRLERPG